MNILIVFLGGGLGATARYGLQGVVHRLAGAGFPYGTLTVNLLGSLLIGMLMVSLEDRFASSPEMRLFLAVGILGGFTTFSSFSFETMALLRGGDFLAGGVNICASVAGCLGATWLGMVVGRYV
jgi:CrcB protein